MCLKFAHTHLLPGSSGECTAAKPDQTTMGAVPQKINPLLKVHRLQSISILLSGNLLAGFVFWSQVYF